MKVGGRRELVIPPHLAYGPAGGHFLGGKTLIFIIDLLNVCCLCVFTARSRTRGSCGTLGFVFFGDRGIHSDE